MRASRTSLVVIGGAALFACGGPSDQAHAPTIEARAIDAGVASLVDVDAATPIATSTSLADAGAETQARGADWATHPDKNAPLSYVIDGACIQASVNFPDNATIVHYGEHGTGFAAIATEHGLEDAARLSTGVAGTYFGAIEGSYPDNLYWSVDNGGRSVSIPQAMRWKSDHWVLAFGADPTLQTVTKLHAITVVPGGALAASYTCLSDDAYCTDLGILGDKVTAPQVSANGFLTSSLHLFPDGEIWAFGRACTSQSRDATCASQVRRKKPGAKTAVDYLGGDLGEVSSMIANAPDDVLIAISGKYLHFDGKKWLPFPWAGKNVDGVLQAAPDGTIYSFANGTLERRAKDGSVKALSAPGKIARVSGIKQNAIWAILDGGSVARWEESEGTWTILAIPKSPFAWGESKTNVPTVTGISVKSARDVWINVIYTEWPSHYGEQQFEHRRALLRTLPPDETLRCNAGSKVAFESSPPLATPACTTPLVILASVSAAEKTDYPQSRKIVEGHAELAGTRYVELVIGDKKILGARVPSYDVGKHLLTLMRQKQPLGMPEMVCVDPKSAREITF